jgi:hypothetical protein
MKSVKLFLAVCALFVCTCSFAQTKEETIEWLQPKLLEYSSFNNFITSNFKIEIGECEIVLSGNDKDEKLHKAIFPTNFIEMAHSEDGSGRFEGNYYSWDESKIACPDDWQLPTKVVIPDLKGHIFITAGQRPAVKDGRLNLLGFENLTGLKLQNGLLSIKN